MIGQLGVECGDDLRSRHVVTSRAVVYRDVSMAGGGCDRDVGGGGGDEGQVAGYDMFGVWRLIVGEILDHSGGRETVFSFAHLLAVWSLRVASV